MLLADRLARSLPAASFELETLIRLVGIEETLSVPTAAVTCRGRARLLINPRFVDKYCTRDEHLFLLVMHEMWHVLLGHTTLYERPTALHNIAFDALINAGLARQHPEPAYRGFFEELNRADVFPQLLLRPPAGWPHRPQYDVPGPEGVSALLQRLYPKPGDTRLEPLYGEIFDLLDADRDGSWRNDVELVGNHSDHGDPMQDSLFGDVVRRIVGHWPPPPFAMEGRDAGRELEGWQVGHEQVTLHLRAQFARVLQLVLLPNRSAGSTVARAASRQLVGLGPLPNPADRLLAARRALIGAHALTNQHVTVMSPRQEPPATALVYLDVSGSMREIIPSLLGLLVPVVKAGRATVRQFSTEVTPLSLEDLVRGQLTTTVGTDIHCVMADIAKRRESRVLIVTDGYVGEPAETDMALIRERGVQLHTLLPAFGYEPDLAPHSTLHHLELLETN